MIYSGIILHKNDIRKNIKINNVNEEIRQNLDEWNIQFLDNTNCTNTVQDKSTLKRISIISILITKKEQKNLLII